VTEKPEISPSTPLERSSTIGRAHRIPARSADWAIAAAASVRGSYRCSPIVIQSFSSGEVLHLSTGLLERGDVRAALLGADIDPAQSALHGDVVAVEGPLEAFEAGGLVQGDGALQ
jgi:hypothetical protein